MMNEVYVRLLVAMSDLFPTGRDHMIVFVPFCLPVYLAKPWFSKFFKRKNIKHKMYKIRKIANDKALKSVYQKVLLLLTGMAQWFNVDL